MKCRRQILGLAMAGALVLMPSAARAQHTSEPLYVTPKVLYSYQSMDDFKTDGYAGGFGVDTEFNGKDKTDGSFGGGLAIGYDFGAVGYAPVRMELEYLYHGQVSGDDGYQVGQGSPTNLPYTGMDQSLKASVQTVMANLYLDFRNDTDFTPYIGVGAGGAYVDAQVTGIQDLDMRHPTAQYYDPVDNTGQSWTGQTNNRYSYRGNVYGQQNSWNFAWNASAGFSYQMTPNVALDLGYRYSDFGKADFGSRGFILGGEVIDQQYDPGTDGIPDGGPGGDDTPGTNKQAQVGSYSYKSSMDLTSHEVILGLRFTGY